MFNVYNKSDVEYQPQMFNVHNKTDSWSTNLSFSKEFSPILVVDWAWLVHCARLPHIVKPGLTLCQKIIYDPFQTWSFCWFWKTLWTLQQRQAPFPRDCIRCVQRSQQSLSWDPSSSPRTRTGAGLGALAASSLVHRHSELRLTAQSQGAFIEILNRIHIKELGVQGESFLAPLGTL